MIKRSLTEAEVEFCNLLGLYLGVDVDTQDPQLYHICWPYASMQPKDSNKSDLGAFCKTKLLWGQCRDIVKPEEISCESCLERLAELETIMHEFEVEQDLIKSHGRLSREVNALNDIEGAVHNYLWSLANPEKAVKIGIENPLQELKDVVVEYDKEHYTDADEITKTHKLRR